MQLETHEEAEKEKVDEKKTKPSPRNRLAHPDLAGSD